MLFFPVVDCGSIDASLTSNMLANPGYSTTCNSTASIHCDIGWMFDNVNDTNITATCMTSGAWYISSTCVGKFGLNICYLLWSYMTGSPIGNHMVTQDKWAVLKVQTLGVLPSFHRDPSKKHLATPVIRLYNVNYIVLPSYNIIMYLNNSFTCLALIDF